MRPAITRVLLAVTTVYTLAGCRDTDPVGPRPNRTPLAPSELRLGNPFIQITAGVYHTCAQRQNGAAVCWGYDQDGQLGVGPAPTLCGGYRCADVPTPIPNLTFRDISAGWRHSCGVATDHTVWCWGANDEAQLGTGDFAWSTSPRQIAGGGGYANTVSAGADLTCGTSTGSFWCFGRMPDGQRYTSPQEILAPNFSAAYLKISVGMAGNDAGGIHVCGYWWDQIVSPSPRIDCFGANNNGENGVSTATATYVPPFHSLSITTNSYPAVGYGFTCADTANGVVCLGDNTAGQLGNSNLLGRSTSKPVAVDKGSGLHGVTAGYHHACALNASYEAYCWGTNDFLQVGSVQRGAIIASPIKVGGGHQFVALAAGANHTCGIGTDLHIWCWGDDYFGQLGDQQRFRQIFNSPSASALPILAIGT